MANVLQTTLYGVIAGNAVEIEAAICEAAYYALLDMGNDVYGIEWANKAATLSSVSSKAA